ncbi:hypothetical protein M5K25_025623 [Dendrobium thyrsiflorum]|uniref:Homeobox-leucine zipper protein n=1 Tax=Dendrobium thyrsiflorum TaxID=117978 RepID=A0ABD0U4J3_DENTH
MADVMESMEEETSLFSSIISSGFYPPMQQEESKVRRPRKKAKDVVDGEVEVCGEGKKRRLSDEQVRFLEMNFGKERKLESCRKINLASEIGLEPKQVAVWFQNRRARWKSKQLEEEYIHLKSSHDAVLIEKCRLENEILNLKDKLVQSEEEVRRLSSPYAASELTGVGSPISPLTMTTYLGEFGMEEENGIMHMSPYADNYSYKMEMTNEPSLWDGMTNQ